MPRVAYTIRYAQRYHGQGKSQRMLICVFLLGWWWYLCRSLKQILYVLFHSAVWNLWPAPPAECEKSVLAGVGRGREYFMYEAKPFLPFWNKVDNRKVIEVSENYVIFRFEAMYQMWGNSIHFILSTSSSPQHPAAIAAATGLLFPILFSVSSCRIEHSLDAIPLPQFLSQPFVIAQA